VWPTSLIYVYIYIYIYTHTYIYIYIYVYTYNCSRLCDGKHPVTGAQLARAQSCGQAPLGRQAADCDMPGGMVGLLCPAAGVAAFAPAAVLASP
jgi:hypothetical protein